jgi:hypothetical protein
VPDDDARVLFELFDESTGRGSAPAEPAAGVPVSKTFRAFAPEQDLLLPPSLDDWLPSEHLSRFIAELVDEHLDLSRIHASYTKAKGAPPYDPRLMVRMGRVALDGTKLRANASRRKAMSYARMSEKEKILADEVSELLAQAEAIDQSEDARFGKDSRGDELPEELRRRESRLAKIREAKQALEDEAGERAEQEARKRAAARGEGEDTTAQRVADAVAAAVPKPKAQRNFTDPQSRIMKTSDGSFHQCFNAQAVVDDGHQVIVAAEVSDCAADVANLMPMTEQTAVNTGHAPGEVLADAGYFPHRRMPGAATAPASRVSIPVTRNRTRNTSCSAGWPTPPAAA